MEVIKLPGGLIDFFDCVFEDLGGEVDVGLIYRRDRWEHAEAVDGGATCDEAEEAFFVGFHHECFGFVE